MTSFVDVLAVLTEGLLLSLILAVPFLYSAYLDWKQPISDEPVADEPWRSPTDFQSLEGLKSRLADLETSLHLMRREEKRLELCRQEPDKYWIWPIRITLWWIGSAMRDSQTSKQAEDLRRQIARMFNGDVQPEIRDVNTRILKLKRRRADCTTAEQKAYALQLDEQVIELEHELQELQEFVEHRKMQPHQEYQAKFEDKKTKRRFDVQNEVFEAFERPFEKQMTLREKYKELSERIQQHPVMSPEEKKELQNELDRRFSEHAPKETDAKRVIPIYKKDA